ncbi:MAG: AhpC/TSA family protein [Bacteroidales bacterium]|nr:AhpC/TSA family protein [Bacteroidales bacterium]
MKINYILITLLIFVLSGCMPKKDDGTHPRFDVECVFAGMEGDTAYLKLIKDNGYEFIDSSKVGADGSFRLEGNIASPDFYILHFASDNSRQITLIPDTAQHIKITGRVADFPDSYEVEGSPESEFVCKLIHQIRDTRAVSDSLGRIFRANVNSPDLAEIKHNLDSVYNVVYKKQRAFSENFIKENPDALAQIICLSQYISPKLPVFDPQKDFHHYNNVSQRLSERYPENLQAIKLASYVEKIRLAQSSDSHSKNGVQKGQDAPDIVSRNIKGDTVKLSSLKGKYILVDFWASWSDVSKTNADNLSKIYWKYRYNNFTVYQVAIEENTDNWKNGIKAQRIPWVSVSDLMLWNSPAAEAYGVRALPASFLISPDFKIVDINLTAEKLDDRLLQLVGKPIKRTVDTTAANK